MIKKIAILGDSLTFGYLPMGIGKMNDNENWPEKLREMLSNFFLDSNFEIIIDAQPGRTIKKPIIDFGFPQDNGEDRLLDLYQKAAPFDLFIVFLGTNDYFGYDAYQQMSEKKDFVIADEITASLDILIKKMSEIYYKNMKILDYKVLVVCPPKVLTLNEGKLLESLEEKYELFFKKINIPVANLQTVANPKQEDLINYDGIHYTKNETDIVAKVIFEAIITNKLL